MNDHSEGNNCANLTAEQPPQLGISRVSVRAIEPFEADRKDAIFALLAFGLGFCFTHWVLFSWQGWGVTIFTLAYCTTVAIYLLKKGVHIPRAGWFWLTIVVLTGISFSLWTNNGLGPWPALLLFCSAIYWIMSATGLPILGKTSDLIGLDFLNALLVIPLRNFGCQYKSLAFWGCNKKTQSRQFLSVVLGLILALIVIAMVFPLLMKADSGGFSKITSGCLTFVQGMQVEVKETIIYIILAIPTGAYLFGLIAGSAHKRGCDMFKKDSTLKFLAGIRILPLVTVYTVLGLLCTLYVLFIGSQLPYFFSAFVGERPEGWQVYSEYARSGFFELCRIAAINLIVLTAANLLSRKQCRDNMALKILNSLLAILTLILITTALSKMVMYIGAYGLSMRRLLPCIFMIFLVVLCGGVVALQRWSFSITRLAVGVGVVMLCLLCLSNPDRFVANYNAERFISGTLEDFDVDILYRSGPAGVDSALKVYERTNNRLLQDKLKEYLLDQKLAAQAIEQPEECLQTVRARQKIQEYSLQ